MSFGLVKHMGHTCRRQRYSLTLYVTALLRNIMKTTGPKYLLVGSAFANTS